MLMANRFSSGAPHIHIPLQLCNDSASCLVCQSGDGSALSYKVSAKVSSLNDDTYRWDSVSVIVSSFGQIEQDVH